MDSAPPHSVTFASPRTISFAPCTMASNPDPQSRLIVRAPRSWGTPDLSAM